MWCPDRAGAVRAALGAALLLATAACDFRPLYGADGGRTVAALADVKVLTIADRPGQILRTMLVERLNPAGEPARPAYTLQVRLSERIEELGVRKDATATRGNLILSAAYTLAENKSGRRLASGTTHSVNSYNILTNEFATLSAEQDARRRALRAVSEEIKARVALALRRAALAERRG